MIICTHDAATPAVTCQNCVGVASHSMPDCTGTQTAWTTIHEEKTATGFDIQLRRPLMPSAGVDAGKDLEITKTADFNVIWAYSNEGALGTHGGGNGARGVFQVDLTEEGLLRDKNASGTIFSITAAVISAFVYLAF